ncbi:site-2 protease family protein [Phormidium sp. CLA17]|uniref:site-2 protease family protein n=1 Tax=Leptolyngbya sp. Cla-17 TaxID=2803751 RepID=UPI0014916F8F|nr:site-2 protease family protein [Leptolyngbya sp. Cla-17]MBM0740622.1 site-2 protease family protein [Leptolyngbya sp. Cla-17]
MFTAITEDLTILTVAFGVGLLAWGFFRARPLGKLGIFAWLQSVVLMAPWLIFFGLAAAGVMLNLAIMLLLLVVSAGAYIGLGGQVRSLKQAAAAQRVNAIAEAGNLAQSVLNDSTQIEPSPSPQADSMPEVDTDVVPLPPEDLKAIQGIFGIDTFFATETIPYQEGAIFRGNLRGDPEAAYTKLSESLKTRLGDTYRLFLVENQDDKPVIIVLPSSRDPQPLNLSQNLLAGFLLIVSVIACLESSGLMLGFDLFENPNRVVETIPFAAGIIGILAAHEIAHWVVADRHNVRLSLPFFIPTLQIGSFGALTKFLSILPNRNVLFDVAFAGPAVGGGLSLLTLLLGLLLSHKGSLFQLPSEFFQGSVLVGTLARVVLQELLKQPIVDVHPFVVLGWLGLVITALNLLPAGQLDGGRIVQAVYGRKIAARTTVGVLIVLGLASFVNPLAFYWALVLLFVQRDLERPCLNEITEPDDARAALCLLALFLMIVTLLPLTPSLAGRLGIGM